LASKMQPLYCDTVAYRFPVIPPSLGFGQALDDVGFHPERLADIPDGASGAISNDRGGDRCSFATVLVEDMLNDFLTPLMLEIDVDVGRLVALLADETLEQRIDQG